jgi:hypothetical protein
VPSFTKWWGFQVLCLRDMNKTAGTFLLINYQ